MPDGIRLEVKGLAELEKKIRGFGPKLAGKFLRAAVNAAAQVIKKEALARAPVLSGRLFRSIYAARVTEKTVSHYTDEGFTKENISLQNETFIVAVRRGKKQIKHDQDAYYWPFVEFGTKHSAARPFIVPAFENKKEEAAQRIAEKLAEAVKKIASEN